jgi:hypothetical protein
MSPDMPSRPANDIHPEDLAVTAREADTRGRFWVHIDGDADRSGPEWAPYRTPRPAWRNPAVTMSGFDPGVRPVLDAMRECRVYGVTAKLTCENRLPFSAAGFLRRNGGQTARAAPAV